MLMAISWFLLVFLQDGGFLAWHVLVFCFVIGACSSVVVMVPSALLPDVVDDDFLKGDHRRGRRMRVFRTVFLLCEKVTVVFTLAMSNFVLFGTNYRNPAATCSGNSGVVNQAQAAEVDQTGGYSLGFIIDNWNIDTIRTLMAGGPAVLILLSAMALWKYPIDRKSAAENFQSRVRTNSIRRASYDQQELDRALALSARNQGTV